MAKAKILGLKQLLQKRFVFLEGLKKEILESFGTLTDSFIMIIWGQSGNGKSNVVMQLLKVLMAFGYRVLYLGLEEGFGATMQKTVMRHLTSEHLDKIQFTDHSMTYAELMEKLEKPRSPKIIVVDSLQYWGISYIEYKKLKEAFPNKIFIFISHASGKLPDGKTADKIRFDACIKVRVEGYIAFIISRFGGEKPFVVWEQGAKRYWGDKYKEILSGKEQTQKTKPKKKKESKPSKETEE
jgi:hypothetical protein